MPPWADDALKLLLSQFPVVAVAVGVGSLVAWYMGRLHRDQERKLQSLYEESAKQLDAERKEREKKLEKAHAAAVEGKDQEIARILQEKNGEIARLVADKEVLQKEKDSFQKQLREAQKK